MAPTHHDRAACRKNPPVAVHHRRFYHHDGALFRRGQRGLYAAEVYWPRSPKRPRGEWRWLDPGEPVPSISPEVAVMLEPGADLYGPNRGDA